MPEAEPTMMDDSPHSLLALVVGWVAGTVSVENHDQRGVAG